MNNKHHISEIISGKIEAKKLDPNDPKVISLIEQTIEEQNKILALKKMDYEKFRNTYITI